MAPLRQYANHPDPMGLWLESLGYYRKVTAKDGSSFFRAVAEQILYTETFHPEVRKQCVDYLTEHQDFFQKFEMEESIEDYLEHLQNPAQWGGPIEEAVVSILYGVNIVVFKEVGVQPQHTKQEEFEKTIMLCSQNHHYDSVYNRDYTKVGGFCQSLVYEVLYKDVFKMEDVDYAVDRMLHDRIRHKNDLGICSPRRFLNVKWSSLPFERKEIEDTLEHEVNARKLLNKGITPFSYKIAKTLDPNRFRNVEFDVWIDYRRGLRYGYFKSGSELRVGVKCLVKLNDGVGGSCVGHIQEMVADKGPVVLFVEDFGEKRTVPYESLEVLRQGALSFQGRGLKPTNPSKQGNKGREGGESNSSKNYVQSGSGCSRNRKTIPCNASCEGNEENDSTPQQEVNLITYGAASPHEGYIPFSNYQVEGDVSVPFVGDRSLQYRLMPQSPVSPLPRHSPLLVPLSPAATSPSGPFSPTEYFQFVPYDNSSSGGYDIPDQDAGLGSPNYMSNDGWQAQGLINFNAPKSLLDSGADLPMSDIQTLRYFYNLGIDFYRANCFPWNGLGVCSPGVAVSCGPSYSVADASGGKVGSSAPSDSALPPQDRAASGSRRKRRETSVSSPGGVSMSSESETGDFSLPNAAPSPSSNQSPRSKSGVTHVSPRFKKGAKSAFRLEIPKKKPLLRGKSKAKDTETEKTSGSPPSSSTAPAHSLSSKRTGNLASRLEPLVLNDISAMTVNEHVMSPMTSVPYGYLCYPNMPFSPVDSDPNMPFFPSYRIPTHRQQCYSPVSEVGSPFPLYAPSSHFIFPASPGVYVGTPTWAAITPPTP